MCFRHPKVLILCLRAAIEKVPFFHYVVPSCVDSTRLLQYSTRGIFRVHCFTAINFFSKKMCLFAFPYQIHRIKNIIHLLYPPLLLQICFTFFTVVTHIVDITTSDAEHPCCGVFHVQTLTFPAA